MFLNATGRYERSSVLPKWFFYPSVGVSFVPTKAFESIKGNVLNYAKAYVNLSKVGNTSSIPAYALTDVSVVASGFPFSDLYGFRPRTVGYSTTSPEFMITKEAGFNLGFFIPLLLAILLALAKSIADCAISHLYADIVTGKQIGRAHV